MIRAIKGFDKNLQCRGFQFEVGKTYKHDGPVEACKSGFHSIEGHPLGVFEYYPPSDSRFAYVDADGDIARHYNDSKIASEILTVVREVSLYEIIADAGKWVMDRSTPEGESATGYRGAASATGDQGAASATGDQGAASATGYRGAASATGYQGAASATGYRGAASATGALGAASATGTLGAASATGALGAASATGTLGAAMSCGYLGSAMGADGNALFLCERASWDGPILSVWAGIVGQGGIKAGVWYRCEGGKPVEASQ